MTEFEQVMMERDGMSAEEARMERNNAREMLYDALAQGDDYEDIEDILAGDYGLEMDYIFDLI